MRSARLLLGTVGVVLVLVGAWNLVLASPGTADLVSIALYAAGGVVAHDLVLAPLVALAGVVVVPRLGRDWRVPAVAGVVVLASVTLMAVPVLGRFGAKPDDPSLLNRPYGWLWLGFAVLVALGVVLAGLVTRQRRRRREGRRVPA